MRQTNRILFSLLALCILGGAIYLTVALISPPAPLPVDAPATEFSAGRAMQDLEVITRQPHPMGISQGHADVVAYLVGEIRELGLEPQVQDTFGLRLWSPGSGYISGGFVENITVRLRGTNPEGAILLTSHYDSVPGGPAATCSGSGVVTVLELLRALHAGPPLRQDVIFLFTDGEEPGTLGAHAFVAQHPWLQDVRLALSMDQFRAGPPHLVATSRGDGLWVQTLAQGKQSTRPAYSSFPFNLFPAGETDLLPFKKARIRGADILTIAPATEVHTALDLPKIVDPGSVQQAGNQILALVRYLGSQPNLEMDYPDQTFFPVLGRLIHYPSGWAMPLAVVSELCFLGMLFYGFRKIKLTWKGMGLGFLAFLLGLTLSVVIAALLWLGIQALHPEYAYDLAGARITLSDDNLYTFGFFVLALAVITGSIAVARRRVSALDLAAGALVIWFPATILMTILLPASSYPATWVLLSGSLALLPTLVVQDEKKAWVLSGLGFLASAILATILWIPWIFIAVFPGTLGSGLMLMSLMMVIVALWIGSMVPILDWITSPKRWLLPAAAALVALGFLVAGHFLVGRDSPPPLVNSIGYWLDAQEGEAYWVAFVGGNRTNASTTARYQVAFPEAMDERQIHLLVNPTRRPYTELFPEAPQFSVLTSAAPPLTLDGPRLDVISDEWVDSRRVVTIRFTTSMHDRLYIVIPEAPLVAITVPNNERTELAASDGWWLRFDGMPLEGMEICFEFSTSGPLQVLLVEEKTGLPSFPGLITQPEPGTMKLPGEFLQGIPTDFTAINRNFVVQGFGRE